MSQITVDATLCMKGGACVEVCPSRCLSFNQDGFPEERSDSKCILCGHCLAVCPTGALAVADLPIDSFEPLPSALPALEQMDGLLRSRRSIRAFKEDPVSRDVILSLLDVARRAPTARNSQKLHWIVVEGQEKVHALAKETVNGLQPLSVPPGLLDQWKNGYDFVLRGAPMLVVACAPTEYEWGKEDAAIALTYFEMAANVRGIGTCWAGYLTAVASRHAPLCRLLNVPDGFSVRGCLMVGESKHTYLRVPPRKALSLQWC